MSTKESRFLLFKTLLDGLEISQGDLALWMYHDNTKLTRKYVSRKYTGNAPVSASDISLLHALTLFKAQGYDVKSVEFSERGELVAMGHSGLQQARK